MPGHGYRPKLSAGGQNQLSTEVKKFIAGRGCLGSPCRGMSPLREHLRSNQNIGLEGIVTSSDIAAKVMLPRAVSARLVTTNLSCNPRCGRCRC